MAKYNILVVGAPRSGTSSVSHLLGSMFDALPQVSFPADDINLGGYWEPLGIVRAHEALLRDIGSTWHDIQPWNLRRLRLGQLRNYKMLLWYESTRSFKNSPVAVLKDPRISRLLPLWRLIFRDQSVWSCAILVYRPFSEVVTSLEKAFSIPQHKGVGVWLRYVFDAERQSRHMPRSLVMYQDLLKDHTTGLANMRRDIGSLWPTTLEKPAESYRTIIKGEFHRNKVATLDKLAGHPFLDIAIKLDDIIRKDVRTLDLKHVEIDQLRARFEKVTRILSG